jgi:hypothetical protein
MNDVVLLVIGGAVTLVVQRLIAWFNGTATVHSLKRYIKELEQKNSDLREERDKYLTAEQDRIAEQDYQKNHGRHDNEVQILRMLRTKDGTRLKQITDKLGISEELVIKHIVDLCRDNFVRSPHYMPGSDEWSLDPDMTVWYICQPGRDYLAQNPPA